MPAPKGDGLVTQHFTRTRTEPGVFL